MTTATAFTTSPVRQATGEQLDVLRGGSGPGLLFLHGFEGRPEPGPFFEALAERRRLIAPSHPGFDASDDFHGIEDVVDLALLYRQLIEREGGPVDVVGHSMGGMIAAEVAALSPHLVRRLVLVNPFGLWRDEIEAPDLFVMTPGELRRATWAAPPASAAAANGKPAGPSRDETIRRYRNLGSATRYLWPIPDRGLGKRARYIQAPTLALFGASDGLIPAAFAPAWEQAIPGLEARVEEGGHMLPFEQPARVAATITAFLGS